MIDIDLIRKEPERVKENLARRGVPAEPVDKVKLADETWRQLDQELTKLKAQQNAANRQIASANGEEREKLIVEMKEVSQRAGAAAAKLKGAEEERLKAWRRLPNLVLEDVPDGEPANFEVVRTVPAEVPATDFPLKSYLDIAEPRLIDIARAAKVSGSRFAYLKGELARLQIGLVSFVFDRLMADGFVPVIPPVLIAKDSMAGMGYMDAHPEEIYQTQDDLCLVGTSEQSIGPMHRDEILPADQLPLRYAGYSSCFRREVGSHGKDVRGILRVHQFDKIEMFSFTRAEDSSAEHERLLQWQESFVQALELPYRIIKLAARDLGNPSAKTYDIETWIPSESRYRETHSTSNTTDYQARRLNIRYKDSEGKAQKAHLLNGTALAIGRTLIALIENHQQPDGSIAIPSALHKYLPFTAIGKD